MPSASSSHRQLHSWRGAKRPQGTSSYAKWIAASVVIALLLLMGWLLWLLLPARLPQTHVVAMATGEAHKFTVPPIPFAHEDLARLAQTTASSYRFHDFARFQEASNIRDLGKSLQGLSMREEDVLVVYVSAHGVSDAGTAYLLCRDYDLRDKEEGRYAVTELLGQLEESTAKTKLLVLDTAWILSDPRLGMIVNEFPVLMEDIVASHDDANLWVLLSCSLLQSPTTLFAEQRTVFGHSFTEGLLGGADLSDRGGNEDGFVSLDELFTFVLVDCQREAAGGQTPVLLHAGQRLDQLTQAPQGIQLGRAGLLSLDEVKAKKGKESKEENSETKQATPAPKPETLAGKGIPAEDAGRRKNKDASLAESTAGSSNAKNESLAAGRLVHSGANLNEESNEAPLSALLHQAWQLRDRLESLPETNGKWSPIEFAPREWRELNALLLDIDLRSRAGSAFDETRLRRQLNTHIDGLQRLEREDWIRAPTMDRALVVHRLLMSAGRFAKSPERATFTTESRELQEVGEAVRYFHRLSFRLPDYLRCHGELALRWANNADLADVGQHVEQLAQGLLRFQVELRAREGQSLVVSSADDSLVERARGLRETDENFQALLQLLCDFLTANGEQPANRDRIVGLLQTPVWSAAQRQRLVTCLDRPLKSAPQAPPAALPQQWSVSARQWEQILQHARLQARLFEVPGAADVNAAQAQLAALDAAIRSPKANYGQRWEETRGLGRTCESWHLSLRERVRQEGIAAPARWLDARDASLLMASEQRDFFPQLRLRPPRQPDRIEVVQNPPGSLRIDKDQASVEIEVHPSNPNVRSVSIAPDFDEKKLRVQRIDGGSSLRSGRPVLLPVEPDRVARLRLQIKTVSEREELMGGQYPIELQVQAGTQSVPHVIQCAVPKPNDVDLFVERIDPRERGRQFGRNATELRPLVNRITYFRLLLANLSGQAKQVDVALYPIPDSDWAPGRLVDEYGEPFVDLRSWLFQTGSDRLLPGVEPVAQTAQAVSLPADARLREVDLSPKVVPQPESPKGDPPAAEPKSPKDASPVEITHGLACVITNVADPSERWVKWIEINALAPREYVEPGVTYDPAFEQIMIEVSGLDTNSDGRPDGLPGLAALASKPIDVAWDTTGVVPPGAERNDRALIDRPQAVARLNARVPPHPTRSAVIRLNVDGYPRAFVYELALNRKNIGRDIRRDERSIRITSLQMRNENRVFRTTRRDIVEKEQDRDDAKTDVVYLNSGMAAAFAVPGKGDAILVGFEVNAPLDAFSFRDRSDVIEIGFTKAGFRPARLHADRRMQAWLLEATSAGIAVSTQVGDYIGKHAVPLDIAGLKNARVRLQARLEVDQDDPPPHELEIVLDGEAPVLSSLKVPAAVRQGQPLPVSVEVNDLSGPAKAVFGLVTRPSDELKEDQATVLDSFSATATADRWPIAVSLDSAKLEPNEYFVKARVTDRVGKQTEVVAPVTIQAPLPKKQKTMPLKGTIQGVVRFGPKFKPDRITVRIKGSSIAPATTSNGGRFTFLGVPAGTYTIEARGPVRGYIKEGKAEIELKSKEDYSREISINLSNPESPK